MKILMRILAPLVTLFVVFGLTSIAQADTPPSCADVDMTTATGSCADVKESSASAHDTDSSYASVKIAGKVVGVYNMVNGIKLRASEKTTAGCKLVRYARQIPSGAHCIRGVRASHGKPAFHFINSDKGVVHKWQDYVGNPHSSTPSAPWIKFVKRNGQWYKAGYHGVGNCGNKVWFHGTKPKLTAGQVALFRSWEDVNFSAHIAGSASSTATAISMAWCSGNGVSASASAGGYGMANASYSASITLKGITRIKTWLKGTSASLHQQFTQKVTIEATANAKTDATANAWTKVSCSGAPPQTPGPQLLEMTTVNDVLINNTRTIGVTGSVAPTHSATLFCSAVNGGSITVGKTQTVSGTFTVQVTYLAPSEVPASGTDRVDCVLTQDDGQHVSKSTNTFVIQAPVPDPK